jgi:aconitate hydratase
LPVINEVITQKKLLVAAVLSGNRNFEARIHQMVKLNYLASPLLVLAYALAGTINIDFSKDPLGTDNQENKVLLKDIWPEKNEMEQLIKNTVRTDFFKSQYSAIFEGDRNWQQLPESGGKTFDWGKNSTYIKKPPFFQNFSPVDTDPEDIQNARVLLHLGDSITTDHISPAGAISEETSAGQYLLARGTAIDDFNSYGSRRGNHEVMTRGTFANIRIKNKMVKPREGGYTLKFPEEEELQVFEAAEKYAREKIPLIVLAGKEYGTGSSRDWAAKGCRLLGIKAIIAESFERIHRSNLVGTGILPLVFRSGENCTSLGLDGSETYFINGLKKIKPQQTIRIRALKKNQTQAEFSVIARLDNEIEVEYFKSGGLLPYVLKQILKKTSS